MSSAKNILRLLLPGLLLTGLAAAETENSTPVADAGVVKGQVTLARKGSGVHGAEVFIVQLNNSAYTDEEGSFEITGVRPGTHDVIAHLGPATSQVKTVQVQAGQTVTVDFQLALKGTTEEITVTGKGREESTFHAIQSVSAMDSFDLVERAHVSLGEVLDREPGVAKRSWGPGSSRPVIRGFDGDRVLILSNGLSTGSLSSQSGDHGETLDVLTLDRVEVVRGPAALLYGSNAIGGVVNAIKRHHQVHEHPHEGMRGYLTAIGGSGNGQAGTAGGAEYGLGQWLIWGNGSGQRTGDYSTPLGPVGNSKSRASSVGGGIGRYTDKFSFGVDYAYDDRRYGIPYVSEFEAGHGAHNGEEAHENVDLALQHHTLRLDFGLRELRKIADQFDFSLSYGDYAHQEIEVLQDTEQLGTAFANQTVTFRGVFDQKSKGPLSGSFGFSGSLRDYEATGKEAISPPVKESGFALFGLQELDLDAVRLQFGGRVEHRGYDPLGLNERGFTGFSGAAGVHVPLWKNGAGVLNYSHTNRSPALEELYNNGPHIGNLAYEIGNPDLKRERTDGVDVSLRHSSDRMVAKASVFYYDVTDFVFLAPTGEFQDGLIKARYMQDDARYMGSELAFDLGLHPSLWLSLGMDVVDAELRDSGVPLPRIPPVRGTVGLDIRYKGLSIKPELLMANEQNQLFVTETRTPGYATAGIRASYIVAQDHLVHSFSFDAVNVGDILYRNHLSLIKDLAPEMGRAVRFAYTMRFF